MLHTFTWICNVFGVFFIIAAHEHYSIDVFVAFYIASRLFMYYHTLANQKLPHSLIQKWIRMWKLFFDLSKNSMEPSNDKGEGPGCVDTTIGDCKEPKASMLAADSHIHRGRDTSSSSVG